MSQGYKQVTEFGTYWFLDPDCKILHRLDGPAVIQLHGDVECWYFNGVKHRTNGPAITHADGSKTWYYSGLRHREDGPACEWANGCKNWYLNGNPMSESEFDISTNRPPRKLTMAELEAIVGFKFVIT